jgi:molybdopterin-guanine dinucleotide biosynthesis protein A
MNRSRETFRYAAAILAGGQARRLGGLAKGTLDAGGVSVGERLRDQLRAAGVERIVLVANDPAPYHDSGLAIIGDLRPGNGPLGGIEAALAHWADRADAMVIVPCDMPRLGAPEIATLIDAFAAGDTPGVCARTGDFFWHPLCSVVHNALASRISAAIDAGQRSVRELWEAAGVEDVGFDDDAPFTNINTPEDLANFQADRPEASP